jgi:TatD DNase family protein
MIIDTHAHLNFNAYINDVDEVITRTLNNNIWVINVGSQYSTSDRAVKIAKKYKQGVYAAIGLHPIHVETGLIKIQNSNLKSQNDNSKIKNLENILQENFDYKKYKELAKSPKVVAIGEAGLDYYYKPKTKTKLEQFKNKQREVLLEQLRLAHELSLPVIFHCRMAHEDLLEVLNFQFSISNFQLKAVIHCFTGTWEQAQQYMEIGLYLGFNGLIFKMDCDDIIKKTPVERILLETDCPYLPPPQFTTPRNEPTAIKYIAEKIAAIKDISFDKIIEVTTINAKKLFNL